MSKNYSLVINPFDWTLTHKESIYNKVKTYELVDKKYLYGFINTGLGVNYREDKRYLKIIKYQNEQKQMLNYLTLEDNGKFKTSHSLPKHKWGRVKPTQHLSMSIFCRKTRHTLAKDNYIDIDMVNCHSQIYLAFATYHNLPHEALTAYCLNPKLLRKSIIEMHLPELLSDNLTIEQESEMKDIAKNLPIRLANGGTYKQWKEDNNIKDNLLHPDIIKIESELKNIMDKVYENNTDMLKDIVKENGTQGYKKNIRTVMSLWSQTIERHVQECAIEYLNNWYKIEGIIPCQDGFMIEKKNYYEDIINDINDHVESIYPYGIKFTIKPFDEGIEIPKHDKLNETVMLTNDDETNYFNLDYEYFELEQEKLDIDYNDFDKSDVFIVQSGTGTGKSTLISKLYSEYKRKNPKVKILCLSNLTSILDQLTKTFHENGTKLFDYSKVEHYGDIINRDSTMCINSIMKIVQEDYSNTVLFIDEPTNLLFGMCGNSTIRNIKQVTACFIDLFKNAKKVILTDAHMTKGVEELIKLRKTEADDIYYYINSFKKFSGINATNIEDSDLFIKNLIDNVKAEKKFICACDSKSKAESLYATCIEYSQTEKNKFVLITADTKDIEVNKVDFSNSYVFLSPRVTCGVSIVTKSSLDSYIYICGKSINPITLYQQCTRNRNMSNLFYHIEDKNKSTRNYLSFETCVDYHTIKIQEFEDLTNSCTIVDKYENLKIQQNFYFNLFCHKEYCESLMFKSIKYYFEKELVQAGFILKNISDQNNDLNFKEELKENITNMKDGIIDDLAKTIKDQFDDLKYQSGVIRRCRYLNINTSEDVIKYREVISDERLFDNHNQFEKVLRTTEYVKSKITDLKTDKFSVDVLGNSYCKVLLLKNLEESLKIKSLDIDNFTCVLPKDRGKLLFLCGKIKNQFKLKTVEITDVESCKKVYLKILKNLSGSLGIFQSLHKRIKGKDTRYMDYDCDNLQHFIDLVILKNRHNLGRFDEEIIKSLQDYIIIPKDTNLQPYKKCIIDMDCFFDDE